LLLLGDAEDARHDWPGAEAAYRGALAADPNVPRGHYSLGLLLYKQRRYSEAARAFDRELAADADYPPALQYRAELELDRGDTAAALPLLERLTSVAPGHAEGWRALGRARIDQGRPAEAAAALRRSIELSPEDPSAHFLLGRAYAEAGRGAEAAAAFSRAAELNQRTRDRLQQRLSGKKFESAKRSGGRRGR
jgi:protein O-GlcNAc transferase